MSIVQRVRERAVCPPSLLSGDRVVNVDGFEQAVANILDNNTLSLTADGSVTGSIKKVVKMADRIDKLPVTMIGKTRDVLEQRRCIILAIVGSTPSTSTSLARVLSNGYLTAVKGWLDDILSGSVGGIDLLLHLLSNIRNLPVTKSLVKNSGMGKAIGSIEKHRICVGTKNQDAIMKRVQLVKDAWNKSVKSRKEKDDSKISKRALEAPSSPSAAKRSRFDDDRKKTSSSSLKNLLKKVSDSSPDKGKENSTSTVRTNAVPKNDSRTAQDKRPHILAPNSTKPKLEVMQGPPQAKKVSVKKPLKRVKWADHFGGNLTLSKVLEREEFLSEEEQGKEGSVSWSDRKRRDRLREKELIAKAKKAKLCDEDDEIEMPKVLKPLIPWRQPSMLPDNLEIAKPQLNSQEIAVQIGRISKVAKVQYSSDYDVPPSPAPLSDVEQALEMTQQSSIVAEIPFFVPQPDATAAAVSASAPSTTYAQPDTPLNATNGLASSTYPPAQTAVASSEQGATAQLVQALGLPMFLVGQNVQALQTLASSPGLLSTLVEPNGMYDEARLMGLVQNLTQNITQNQQSPNGQTSMAGYQQQQTPAAPAFGSTTQQSYQPSNNVGIYGPASTTSSTSSFGQSPSYSSFTGGSVGSAGGGGGGTSSNSTSKNNGYRGDQNNSECNLHLSGYGPNTTQADIITLFAPYVQVDEVVMKGTFSFVNTSDSVGAKRAREALNGALLGGMPVRINVAQRRARDPNTLGNSNNSSNNSSSRGKNGSSSSMSTNSRNDNISNFNSVSAAISAGAPIDENSVRDDRGNTATKNLFVAGYGPGTSEQQLRDIFGQHATIIGVIMKGTFSFVNTADRISAIHCREALSSTVLNGGILRINFAKETGRLGTSFDLTYGPGGGPGGPGGPGCHGGPGGPGGPGVPGGPGGGNAPAPMPSHYGRSY